MNLTWRRFLPFRQASMPGIGRWATWTTLAALSAALSAAPAALQAAEPVASATAPLPAEAFFGDSELDQGELSPSGRWLALAVQPPGLRRGLAVYDLHGDEAPRELARFSDIDIGSFHWVGEDALAFDLLDKQRGSGEQRRGSGLFTVRRDGTGLRQQVLMNWWRNPGQGTRASRRLDATHQLVHVPLQQAAGAETVIVRGARNPGNPLGDWVLKRLNIVSGEVQALNAAEPAHTRRWWFDAQGQPLFGLATQDGQTRLHERVLDAQGEPTRDWKVLLEAPTLESPWALHSRDLAGRLYVTQASGPQGEATLRRFDRRLGQPEAEALVAVPGFDFIGALVEEAAPGQDPLLGVTVLTDAPGTVWLHPGMAAVQQAIDERLPGRSNLLQCRRCRDDDRTVLVESRSDRHPGEWWVWRGSAKAPGAWRRLGVTRPDIDPQRMAEVAFTRYAARDGLGIPLWVTLPTVAHAPSAGPQAQDKAAGQTPPAARPAPAVVLVHGGPWTRGSQWAWHPLPQFLASRGYVVLEPEFRGSTGFGDRHYRAGWKQWGRAMQDDLADAVQWAVDRGLVDPQRVCIAGGSYGGYAALMGLVRQAQTFRCAAAWVPLADLRWLLREGSPDDWSDEVRSALLPVLLADRVADSELVTQISPLEQADRIRSPLFLAWGEEDMRTPPDQTKALLKALQAAGQSPEAVGYEGEGHGWLKKSTRVDFAQRLEAFLARSLAAPAPMPAR